MNNSPCVCLCTGGDLIPGFIYYEVFFYRFQVILPKTWPQFRLVVNTIGARGFELQGRRESYEVQELAAAANRKAKREKDTISIPAFRFFLMEFYD